MRKLYSIKIKMKKRFPIGKYTGRTITFGRYWDKDIAERVANKHQKELDKIKLSNLLKKLWYKIGRVQVETKYI